MDRFWSKVKRNGVCLEWQAFRNKLGYGMFRWAKESKSMMLAHRASWILVNGEIPDGQLVLHRCDNPSCVNPEHLFLGTNADNVADRDGKGRTSRARRNIGEEHPLSLLNEEKVRQIRELVANGQTHRLVAEKFGIHFGTVSDVVNRKRWKHVT